MKTLLIDTHALLWWLSDDRRLPNRSRVRIADPETRVLVSAASAWEVAIKKALGKLRAPDDFLTVVEESGFSWIPISPVEAYTAGSLLKSRRKLDPEMARSMVRVREARRAFRQFHTTCFWWCDPAFEPSLEDVGWVAEQLMRHGGRSGWALGARLCR